ncbi:MAG TPA: class I SAM-dependent methyltransferase [Caulobacteraceae bacterium]|jgi:demethylmenaquinone methyltransferase/2-methoxy-6-polyprenyl-1,4-benzoquinol methylase|nr:class I SAM-dependent methyltransferase [Caulobacteraceae bacterium]
MTSGTAAFGFRDVEAGKKPTLVRDVFNRVAPRYDLMNDLMSGGVHRLWKDAAAARLNPQPGESIVDCAGGTGDMAKRLARMSEAARTRRGGAAAHILVIDFNAAMVAAGRTRCDRAGIEWAVGDVQALPLADAAADAVCIAFGLRNVTDVSGALGEARRVLKPGGRFLCLEFSRPLAAALRAAYDAYSFRVIPAIGAAVAKDREAYLYLVESIRRFPDQGALAALMGKAGFARVSVTNFSGGVCALHQGWAIPGA